MCHNTDHVCRNQSRANFSKYQSVVENMTSSRVHRNKNQQMGCDIFFVKIPEHAMNYQCRCGSFLQYPDTHGRDMSSTYFELGFISDSPKRFSGGMVIRGSVLA